MTDRTQAESRGFVADCEVAVVLQAPIRQAIDRILADGAIEIGQPPGEKFDPVSVVRALHEAIAAQEAQPLAVPILRGLLSGQIQVNSSEVRAGRIPTLEELLVRLVAVQRELAEPGQVSVADAFSATKLETKAYR
jgi:hypothetical protein